MANGSPNYESPSNPGLAVRFNPMLPGPAQMLEKAAQMKALEQEQARQEQQRQHDNFEFYNSLLNTDYKGLRPELMGIVADKVNNFKDQATRMVFQANQENRPISTNEKMLLKRAQSNIDGMLSQLDSYGEVYKEVSDTLAADADSSNEYKVYNHGKAESALVEALVDIEDEEGNIDLSKLREDRLRDVINRPENLNERGVTMSFVDDLEKQTQTFIDENRRFGTIQDIFVTKPDYIVLDDNGNIARNDDGTAKFNITSNLVAQAKQDPLMKKILDHKVETLEGELGREVSYKEALAATLPEDVVERDPGSSKFKPRPRAGSQKRQEQINRTSKFFDNFARKWVGLDTEVDETKLSALADPSGEQSPIVSIKKSTRMVEDDQGRETEQDVISLSIREGNQLEDFFMGIQGAAFKGRRQPEEGEGFVTNDLDVPIETPEQKRSAIYGLVNAYNSMRSPSQQINIELLDEELMEFLEQMPEPTQNLRRNQDATTPTGRYDQIQ